MGDGHSLSPGLYYKYRETARGSERIRTVGEVIDLLQTARDAILANHAAHRAACGLRNFTGMDHKPEDVRFVLNRAMPNELQGKSVEEIPDHLIAYVLRQVSMHRVSYDNLGQEARKDAAVLLSLDLESEITRRLTRR